MFSGHWEWVIIAVVALVLFGGRGKISGLMKDMGQGINAFKKGLKDDDKEKLAEKSQEESTSSTIKEEEKA